MKKLFLILSITSLGLLNACTEKIDPVIQSQTQTTVDDATAARISSSIQTNFPSAINIIIAVIDDKKTYSADFTVNGVLHQCCCSASGQILSDYKFADGVPLQEAIKTYLQTTYPGYKLEKVAVGKDASGNASTKVMIEFKDQKITIVFDGNNVAMATFIEPKNKVGEDKNKVFTAKLADLPANIQSQLTEYEFVGAVVKVNADNTQKTYFVTAKKTGILYEFTFDNAGKLIKTESFDLNKKPEIKELKLTDFPKVVQDYLSINYKDWKFEKGTIMTKSGVTDSYTVVISKEKKIFVLIFDKDGKFIKIAETSVIQLPKIEVKELNSSNLPQIIKEYLTKTYVGWIFIKGTITLNDGVAEAYYVNITVGTDKYELIFDKGGKFLLAKRG